MSDQVEPLNRSMFSKTEPASENQNLRIQQNILGRGSGFRAISPTKKGFVQEGRDIFYREEDDFGRILVNDLVNVNLSATRNPQEAYDIQKRNEAFRAAGDFFTNVPLLIGTGGVLGLAGKAALKSKAGKKAVDAVSKFLFKKGKPSAGLTGSGVVAFGTAAGTGIGAALRGLQQGEVEPVDTVVQKDKKLSGKLFDQPKKTKKEETVIRYEEQPLVSKIISNPDFNRFMLNLSRTLTDPDPEKGTTAERLASAPSESFEQKLTGLGGFEPLKSSDASSDVEKNNNISTALRRYQTTVDNIGKLEYAKDQIAEGSGLMGLLGALTTEAKTAIGLELNTPFDQIDPRTQAESLIDAIRQQNIRELLGESGRTISNLDREIVANIFGSITSTTPPSVIRNKLDKVIKNFRLSLGENRDVIVNNAEYFGNVGRGSGVIEANRPLIEKILQVQDFQTMFIPKYNPNEDVQTSRTQGPITDIEYVEGT